MVNFLESNSEYDMVRCNANERLENSIEVVSKQLRIPNKYAKKENIFEDCIFVKGINIFPGVYMVRFCKYKENNPSLYIYKGREGQNWQLLLPSAYNHKCGYLDKCVYNYVIRYDSHSRMERDSNQLVRRQIGLNKNLIYTINNLQLEYEYKENLIERINDNTNKNLLIIYVAQKDKEKVIECFKKIKNRNLKLYLYYLIGINRFCNYAYRIYHKIRWKI